MQSQLCIPTKKEFLLWTMPLVAIALSDIDVRNVCKQQHSE